MTHDRIDNSSRLPDLFAVAFGSLVTLIVSGYQFGRGNHTVYLLEPLRLTDTSLFTRDWFVISTLQYHAAFNHLTARLMRFDLAEPVFLAGYLCLVVLWQTAWLKLVKALGGSRMTYATSVIVYYLSAAGIGLGVYQFLQDGCFLPSNVSSVAMLWGLYLWATGRRGWAGVAMGIAGFFHLSFAPVAIGGWVALSLWSYFGRARSAAIRPMPYVIGTLAVVVPSAMNLINALRVKLDQDMSIPLDRFVDVYVRFRHSHHFDPTHWPASLWISFLWPIPLAVWACLRRRKDAPDDPALIETAHAFTLLSAAQVVALACAGFWFVSETLVQLMFWRFSIYVKLLSCIGVAWLVCDARVLRPSTTRALLVAIPLLLVAVIGGSILMEGRLHAGGGIEVAMTALQRHRGAFVLFAACAFVPAALALIEQRGRNLSSGIALCGVVLCLMLVVVGWDRWLGWGMTPEDVDADYLKLCDWAEEATPVDSVFLVPPAETAFRLEARRAVVVNFKHVPQLGSEILVWQSRLEDVLGTTNLSQFPADYVKTLAALDARYNARPPAELISVAKKYGARYIVVSRSWGNGYRSMLAYRSKGSRYLVYDCQTDG